MSAHTPGPWKASNGGVWSEAARDYGFVASCGGDFSRDERAANAALIASAPDLLAALRECEHWLVKAHGEPPETAAQTNGFHRAIREARAAVAKAEGVRP